MSKQYYIEYPRDFANEYTIYVTSTPEQAEIIIDRFPVLKITRAEAIERGIRRPRQATRNSEQWWGGFAQTADSEYQRNRDYRGEAMTDSDIIHYAAIATAQILSGEEW